MKYTASLARRGLSPGLSDKERDRANHLQYAFAGISDLVKLAGQEQQCVSGTDLCLFTDISFKHALAFQKKHLVLFLVAMERTMPSRDDLHESQGISRAPVICRQQKAGLHAGETGLVDRFCGDIFWMLEDHRMFRFLRRDR